MADLGIETTPLALVGKNEFRAFTTVPRVHSWRIVFSFFSFFLVLCCFVTKITEGESRLEHLEY